MTTPTPRPNATDGKREAAILDLARVRDDGTAPFTPPTPEELGAVLTHVTIESLIGSGGMGAVYRARRKDVGDLVALKILPRELADKPGFQERFSREAKLLAGLHHPHLVTVFDAGQTGGWCWLMMELVDGANLREVMRTGRLSPPQALRLVPQLCDALQYAHDHGVVHRDIKPENILLDAQGRLKLTDFGLAKLIGSNADAVTQTRLTRTGAILGTVHYMAPEQVEGAAGVDHRADIYAVGVVLYEMLTGGLPLGRFLPPSQQIAVDVRVDEVVFKALEKDPERRYQRASDVQRAVEATNAAGHPTTSTAAAIAAGASTKPSVVRVAVITFLVLFAWVIHWVLGITATVAAGWWFYRRVVLGESAAPLPSRRRLLLPVLIVVCVLVLLVLGSVSRVSVSTQSVAPNRATEHQVFYAGQPSSETFITTPGTFGVLLGTAVTVSVIEDGGRLHWRFADDAYTSAPISPFFTPGKPWFIAAEMPAERLWVYDGIDHLALVERTAANSYIFHDRATSTQIAQVPSGVRSRLPSHLFTPTVEKPTDKSLTNDLMDRFNQMTDAEVSTIPLLRPDRFITTVGASRVNDGNTLVQVRKIDGSLYWNIYGRYGTGYSASGNNLTGTTWFIFPEKPARVWIFNGDNDLWLMDQIDNEKPISRHSHMDATLLREAPPAVRGRLPQSLRSE